MPPEILPDPPHRNPPAHLAVNGGITAGIVVVFVCGYIWWLIVVQNQATAYWPIAAALTAAIVSAFGYQVYRQRPWPAGYIQGVLIGTGVALLIEGVCFPFFAHVG